MKKLLPIIIAILLLSSSATQGVIIIQPRRVVAGGGKSYLFQSQGFESGTYSTGELDGQDSWSETTASTDFFMVSNAVAQAGSQSVFINNTNQNKSIEQVYTTQSGKVTYDFYWYSTDVSGDGGSIGNADGVASTSTNIGFQLQIAASNIQYYDGSWNNIFAVNDTTWYHVEVEYDPSDDTLDMWVDDDKKLTGGSARNALTQSTNFWFGTFGTDNDDYYVDDLEVYVGARQ